MKNKSFLTFSILTLTLLPFTSNAYYSEEQYRTDVKQFLDMQLRYQQQDQWRMEDQAILNNLQNELNSNSYEFNAALMEQKIAEQKRIYEELSKQIEESLELKEQMDVLESRLNSKDTTSYVTIPKDCNTLILGSQLNQSGTACVCPEYTVFAVIDGANYCRMKGAPVSNTDDNVMEIAKPELVKETVKESIVPEKNALDELLENSQNILVPEQVATPTEPVPVPIEEVQNNQSKPSLFQSLKEKVRAFFGWMF